MYQNYVIGETNCFQSANVAQSFSAKNERDRQSRHQLRSSIICHHSLHCHITSFLPSFHPLSSTIPLYSVNSLFFPLASAHSAIFQKRGFELCAHKLTMCLS